MKEVEILKRLVSEANVQVNILARLCNCSQSGMSKYLHDECIPGGLKLLSIREGLKKYKEMIDEIIGE